MIVAVGIMVTLHSCTPDEIDAFADGYRTGYEGSSSCFRHIYFLFIFAGIRVLYYGKSG